MGNKGEERRGEERRGADLEGSRGSGGRDSECPDGFVRPKGEAREEGDDTRAPAVSRAERGKAVRWAGLPKTESAGKGKEKKERFQKG